MSYTRANIPEFTSYHNLDVRWDIFGANDYQTFINKLVVKGLFYKGVPDAVVESYKVAEYIMAHAWYYYPMYDEALSKLLRITEMAVKLRCEQLNIPLTFQKGGKGEQKKNFSNLIDELSKAEPEKALKEKLHNVRRLRNSFMHPERLSYGMATFGNIIKRVVNILNALFLPRELFSSVNAKVKQLQQHFDNTNRPPFVVSYQGKRYLIDQLRITEAICIKGHWMYCLVAIPVVTNIKEQIETHNYALPLVFEAQIVSFDNNNIVAVDLKTNEQFHIGSTNHPSNLSTYTDYVEGKQAASESERWGHDQFYNAEAYGASTDFLYRYLYIFEELN